MTDREAQRIETLNNVYIAGPALAELFKVSPDMINKYVADYGLPKASRAKYELRAAIHWFTDRLKLSGLGANSGDIADEKQRLVRAQRQRAEIENKKVRGQLLDVDAVADMLNKTASAYSTQLDGLAPRVAAIVAGLDDPAEIQRIIFNECRAIRANTAATLSDIAASYDSSADS